MKTDQKRNDKGRFIKGSEQPRSLTIPPEELKLIMSALGFDAVDELAAIRKFAHDYRERTTLADRLGREIVQLRILAYSDYPGDRGPYKNLFLDLKKRYAELDKRCAEKEVAVDAQRSMLTDLRLINARLVKGIYWLAVAIPVVAVTALAIGFYLHRG